MNSLAVPTAVPATTVFADNDIGFDYTFAPINELQVTLKEDPKTGKNVVDKVLVKDEPLNSSQRFFTSLYARYGFNKAFFKYFDYPEVFERIADKEGNDRLRLCIERNKTTGESTLLGVSNPDKPIVIFDELVDLLRKYNGHDVTYADGIVQSTHTPRVGANTFNVGGDDFANRFMMGTAIDGYGTPNIYLSLLRLVCQNGMVANSKAFRSTLALGKGEDDVSPAITRALDGFNNDEGFAALRSRLEESLNSWASVNEADSLYKSLVKLYSKSWVEDGTDETVPTGAKSIGRYLNAPVSGQVAGIEGIGSQLMIAFHRMTGDITSLYGVSNVDALSVKRKRSLPVNCTVYDLMNFATEVSSHYAKPSGQRILQGWLGTLITEEYDLEGTRDRFGDFADFHIDKNVLALKA